MNVTKVGLSYEDQQPFSFSIRRVLPCEGFDFKTCIRCPFWKHGKCQNGRNDKERNK